MSFITGKNLLISIFGQSHSPAIGVTLDGLPAGVKFDWEAARAFLKRRATGGLFASKRAEADEFEILSGLNCDGLTCGAPLTCVIRNTDARAQDYAHMRFIPRPGHADYAAHIKYAGYNDASGGGQFSGRLTAPMCLAGALVMQLLNKEGVKIGAHALQIADARDQAFDPLAPQLDALTDAPIRTIDPAAANNMEDAIARAFQERDSVGGVIECAAVGLPAGVGEPMFGGLEGDIARAVFAIPAVKGVEFGAGFGATSMRGSVNNDEYVLADGRVRALTNHAGGILGGISTGMPIVFRAAVKPTPSIGVKQRSVDLESMTETEIEIVGRHDACIVPRAVACVEAACALKLYDAYIDYKRG